MRTAPAIDYQDRRSSNARWGFLTVMTLVISVTLTSSILLTNVRTRANILTVHIIINDDGYRYLVDHFVPEFERKHGATVEFIRTNWANRMERLIISTAAGIPPDVFMNGAEHVKELVDAGFLEPIDRYLDVLPDKDDFYPPSLATSQYEGRQYGLPIYSSPRIFWYRTDLFELGGLDSSKPPTNWDELLQVARRLTRTDGTQVVQQGVDLQRWTGTSMFGNMQEFYMYLLQNDGRLFDPITYEAEFADEAGIDTLRFMVQLRDAVLPSGYSLYTGTGAGSQLYRGVSVIRVDSPPLLRHFYDPNLDTSLADHVSAIVPPPGNKRQLTTVYSDWLGIHAESKNKDLAWAFLQGITSPETLRDFNIAAGFQSPRRSTVDDFVSYQELTKYMYDTINYSVPFPVFDHPEDAMEAFQERYAAVMRGTEPPESALLEAARLWDAIVPPK